MRKYTKRLLCFLLFAILGLTSCGGGIGSAGNETVLKIDGENITRSEYMVYLYTATQNFLSAAGEDVWNMDFDGQTADELLEERTISTLQSVIAAKAYAAENGIALTEEQKAESKTAAEDFIAGVSPEDLEKSLNWADVAAVGPGLGQDETALSCLSRIIRESRLPLVIDADGLNLLSCGGDLARELSRQGEQGRSIVLTPHVGELARLAGMPAESLREDISGEAQRLSARIHGTVAAKDARTFICREGDPICVNLGGNSGMATAGSGDVLTGVIAGLMAQGMDGYRAACVGVYVHGAAGDRASARLGPYACTAGDLISNLCIPPKKQAILIHE